MKWRDQLIERATFRGAPFFVESAEQAMGRRTVVHEYPFSEKPPGTEDMGVKGNAFTLEGYVIGDEYMGARDKLIAELARKGPGELVHPYRGTLRVAVGPVHIRESRADGGFAQFTIEFVETTDESLQPKTFADATANVKSSASDARLSIGADFLKKFDLSCPFLASATGLLDSLSTTADGLISEVQMTPGQFSEVASKASALRSTVESLDPEAMVATQIALYAAIGDALLASGVPDPSGGLLKLYAFDPGTRPVAVTENGAVEQSNFDAAQQLTERLVLVQAAELAAQQTFLTYDDAIRIRGEIIDRIEEQADSVPDGTFDVLQQLQADLVAAVPGEAADLPRLLTYTPPVTLPSLVLAHNIYGDLASEAELVSRNRVPHPGFVAGGVELEVITRG